MVVNRFFLKWCVFFIGLYFGHNIKAYTIENLNGSFRIQAQLNEVLNVGNFYSNILNDVEMQDLRMDFDLFVLNARRNYIITFCVAFMILQILIFYIISYWQNKALGISEKYLNILEKLSNYQQKEYKGMSNALSSRSTDIDVINEGKQIIEILQNNKENELSDYLFEVLCSCKLLRDYESIGSISDSEFNVENETSYEDFEAYTNDVSAAFINWLTDTYPYFSTDELQLCILLRMGLNTKEICNITFQSSESIKSTEAKLRKRLNVDETVLSLSSYLYHSYLESKIDEVVKKR